MSKKFKVVDQKNPDKNANPLEGLDFFTKGIENLTGEITEKIQFFNNLANEQQVFAVPVKSQKATVNGESVKVDLLKDGRIVISYASTEAAEKAFVQITEKGIFKRFKSWLSK